MNLCWVEYCSGGASDCHGSSMSMMSGGASECLYSCRWVKMSGVASDCHSSGGWVKIEWCYSKDCCGFGGSTYSGFSIWNYVEFSEVYVSW